MRLDPPPPASSAPAGAPRWRCRGAAGASGSTGCSSRAAPRRCCRAPGPVPEVVLINTAGGVTGGDRIDWRLEAGAGAALVATTQAAERVYRSSGGAARIETRLTSVPARRWTGCRRRRSSSTAAGSTAGSRSTWRGRPLTALETLVLGRGAMGETVRSGAISDQWRIRRGGRLVHAEALRVTATSPVPPPGPRRSRRARLRHAGARRPGRRDAARRGAGALAGLDTASPPPRAPSAGS